jgi:ABC-type multidrug transport system ATPase subunit
MIEVDGLVARKRSAPRVDLGPLSFSLARGSSYALVGAEEDGVPFLLAILAGVEPPRKGVVTIAGAPAGPRKSVAYVPQAPLVPPELTVEEYLELASSLRGEPRKAPAERLSALGVAPLATQRVRDLREAEVRAIALTEALTSRAELLLLADPLADLDPRATSHVARALDARLEEGATVVLSTPSPADARALGRELLFFTVGKLTRRSTDDDAWQPPVGPKGARLYVRSEGARYLLAELAVETTFQTVHADGAELVVTGTDPVAMASAVAKATRRANVEIDFMTFQDPDGDT